MDRDSLVYISSYKRMCRDILLAIHRFKEETGELSVEIETSDGTPDAEFNEETGKFVRNGNKLSITVYVGKEDEDVE